jgi:hypothetical protein
MTTNVPLLRFAPSAPSHGAPHPVRLCGLRRHEGDGLQTRPLLVERRDEDFIEGLLADLRDPQRRDTLYAAGPRRVAPRGHGQALPRLYAPVQRVFNLALFETLCDNPGLIADTGRAGLPRLDPQKIESCGMVLRRVLATPQDGASHEAWLKSGTRVYGWDTVDPAHADDDPEADRRLPAASVGHPAINARLPANRQRRSALSRRLAGQAEPVHEAVMPAFVAPPDVCAAAGRTVIFGLLQVATGEQSEHPPQAPGYGTDPAERRQLQAHLSPFLADGGPLAFPRAGARFDSDWALAVSKEPAKRVEFEALAALTTTVRQLGVEFDAFGDSAAARALMLALNRLSVEFDEPQSHGRTSTRREPAGDFYQRAYKVLLLAEPGAALTMPHRSARISSTEAGTLLDALCAALDAQYRQLKPARGRFENDSRAVESRYVVRAFVRLKPEHPGCPGRLLWSPYSEEFSVAPWYESAGQPPTLVEMPDLFDRAVLKALKPSVGFSVPPKLAKLLEGDPKKLRDGEGDPGDGLGLAWICSFSIPIVTICAFIVLTIFLSLLNLIFWWLPFLKVCIPLPTRQPPQQ